MTSDEIHLALAETKEEQKRLLAALDKIKAQTLVRCEEKTGGCGMGYEVQEVTYIQKMHYVPPSGCNDGDYHREGSGAFICPKCLHVNLLYNKPEIMKLKGLFKDIVDKYD